MWLNLTLTNGESILINMDKIKSVTEHSYVDGNRKIHTYCLLDCDDDDNPTHVKESLATIGGLLDSRYEGWEG